MDTIENIEVVGGQMIYEKLTNSISKKEYAIRKAFIWIHMLNDNMKPVKWLKPSKTGTKVNFDQLKSREEYENSLNELAAYLDAVNEQYETDLKIKRT